MAFIFGGGTSAKQRSAASSLQFQTSAQGGVIPLVYGTQRIPGNLLDYADFASHTGAGPLGSKTPKTAGASSANTFYTVSYIVGFAQGTIAGTGDFWWDKSNGDGLPGVATNNHGGDGQSGDPYWQSAHSDRFLNYSGTSNLTFDNGNLGKASTLPNLSVEVFGPGGVDVSFNATDADPAFIITDFLTNTRYGAGFPSANLADLFAGAASLSAYCNAAGILLSPLLDSQKSALQTLGEWAAITNSEIVWSGGRLNVIPRGDQPLSTTYQLFNAFGQGSGSTVTIGLTNAAWGGLINATYTFNGSEIVASVVDGGLVHEILNVSALTDNGIWAGIAASRVVVAMRTSVAQATTFTASATGTGHIDFDSFAGPFVYTPVTRAIYSLGDDDFIAQESSVGTGSGPNSGGVNLRSGGAPITGGISGDPVIVTRTSPADAMNYIVLQCKNRGNSYNDHIIEVSDQAAVDLYRIRKDTSLPSNAIADPYMAGNTVAQLALQRALYYRNTYTFKLGWRFCLLEPMDLVQITDARLNLQALTVRITGVEEDDEGMLTITAEDFFGVYDPGVLYPDVGVVLPPPNPTIIGVGGGTADLLSSKQGVSNFKVNASGDPGDVNPPLIFEPPAVLTNGMLEVWIALSGGLNWGGAEVWFSCDDASFDPVGTVVGPAIQGVLSAGLAPPDADPDVTHTLSVDLSAARGQLTSASAAAAANLLTLCYVDGELIAFETATLTGPYRYDLTRLYRTGYGSPSGHAADTQFARLDQQIARCRYPVTLIGKTIYFKFPSFNLLQGGLQDIAAVSSYSFTTTGSSRVAEP